MIEGCSSSMATSYFVPPPAPPVFIGRDTEDPLWGRLFPCSSAKIAAQADRQSILEHFKEYFAGTRHDVQLQFERELVEDRSGQLYAPG